MSLQETFHNFNTQLKIRDTFHNSPKNGFMLKVFLEETPSIIFKKNWVYIESVFKRHFPQFPYTIENFEFMLKVYLQETPSSKGKK